MKRVKAGSDEPQYVTPSGLKGKRGWTDAMIRNMLGGPDKTAPNLHYRRAAPMKL